MKNLIIAILAIGLIISGYFNYRFKQEDSNTLKIHPEKDALEINFYRDIKVTDSALSQPNIKLVTRGTLRIKFPGNPRTGKNCPPEYLCVLPPPGGTSVFPNDLLMGLITESIRIIPRDFGPSDTVRQGPIK